MCIRDRQTPAGAVAGAAEDATQPAARGAHTAAVIHMPLLWCADDRGTPPAAATGDGSTSQHQCSRGPLHVSRPAARQQQRRVHASRPCSAQNRRQSLIPPRKRRHRTPRRRNDSAHHRRHQAFLHRKPLRQVNFEKIFPVQPPRLTRACPTTGSDRGSLRDHDLTLIVRPAHATSRDAS